MAIYTYFSINSIVISVLYSEVIQRFTLSYIQFLSVERKGIVTFISNNFGQYQCLIARIFQHLFQGSGLGVKPCARGACGKEGRQGECETKRLLEFTFGTIEHFLSSFNPI